MPPRPYKKTPEWKNLRRWVWTADLTPYITAHRDGSMSWNDPEIIIERFGIDNSTDLMLASLDNMLKSRYAQFTAILNTMEVV